MYSRLCLFSLLLVFFTACTSSKSSQVSAQPNTLTKKEIKDGWILMFDGESKKGWHVYNNQTDGSAWKVENGTLMLDPKAKGPDNAGGGDIIFEDEFENFHLKLEWKLEKGGNSGIIFQALEDKNLDGHGKPDPKCRYSTTMYILMEKLLPTEQVIYMI